MPDTAAPRVARPRTLRPAVIPFLVAIAAIAGAIVYQSASASAPPDAPAGVDAAGTTHALSAPGPSSAPSLVEAPRLEPEGATTASGGGAVTEEDGVLPRGVTVLDAGYPGIDNLDPALLTALRAAAKDAAGHGIELELNSGWRSATYQDVLLREAVAEHGSEHEAARWVATAQTSPHVAGEAVDIASGGATTWLATHGAAYGLCPVYRNEPWHYELRAGAKDGRCPRLYADPTRDPRMQR